MLDKTKIIPPTLLRLSHTLLTNIYLFQINKMFFINTKKNIRHDNLQWIYFAKKSNLQF